MLELDLQTKVLSRIKAEGGYGRKLANRFLVGIPDLLLCCRTPDSGDVLVLVEVKVLDYANRVLDRPYNGVTDKQHLELVRFRVGLVLVGVTVARTLVGAYILPGSAREMKCDPCFFLPYEKGAFRGELTPLLISRLRSPELTKGN